ncbi:hypothetical protein DFH07DRAFT_1063896 [Mycena maculata]|uniref:Uncharacterized protein n=1 Tax=Mycena maculata TaxID=230809 RepID=A0AAD7IGJ1_9AGAR|nr:hypothetical protein DFH07DRAFT_1063896 [Mycena maculata]
MSSSTSSSALSVVTTSATALFPSHHRPSSSIALPSITPSGLPPCSNGPCSAPPATLYLYTFLSTLIILMCVSAAIIVRSVILRRRQQIAIANGTWVTPTNRREHVYIARPRPQMFDLYIADGEKHDEKQWGAMKPLSASPIAEPAKAPTRSPHPESMAAQHGPLRRAVREEIHDMLRFFRAPPAPPPPTMEPAVPSALPTPTTRVRVATLVAMPARETEELPYLEFGVLDAEVVDPGRMSAQSEGASEGGDLGAKV